MLHTRLPQPHWHSVTLSHEVVKASLHASLRCDWFVSHLTALGEEYTGGFLTFTHEPIPWHCRFWSPGLVIPLQNVTVAPTLAIHSMAPTLPCAALEAHDTWNATSSIVHSHLCFSTINNLALTIHGKWHRSNICDNPLHPEMGWLFDLMFLPLGKALKRLSKVWKSQDCLPLRLPTSHHITDGLPIQALAVFQALAAVFQALAAVFQALAVLSTLSLKVYAGLCTGSGCHCQHKQTKIWELCSQLPTGLIISFPPSLLHTLHNPLNLNWKVKMLTNAPTMHCCPTQAHHPCTLHPGCH